MKKLAIIITHPIQYYAPVFQLLHQRKNIEIKVFYTWGENALVKHDPGFERQIEWDIPLLDGYPFEWVVNKSKAPGSHHYNGIINPSLITQIEAFQARAILVFGWAYKSHFKVMRYFKNKLPVYFRGDSHLLDNRSTLKDLMRAILLKYVYRQVDHAFYVGTNNKNYFLKYGLKINQLSFAPHAVDNNRFSVSHSTEALSIRKKIGLANDDVLILFVGKFEEKKSPFLLLDAFLRLNNKNGHLLFVGSGRLEKLLKQHAEGYSNVHFFDFVNQANMPAIYQACDLFCLPSSGPNETWGLAVNEAMAASKAIIVSNKCGCAADLVNEANGLVFNSGQIDELLTGLETLMADSSNLKAMGKHSANFINKWNFQKVAEAIETQLLHERF